MQNLKQTIAIVDDNITNLAIGQKALIGKYQVFTIPTGMKLFTLLENVTPDLILLDIEMPEMNGFEVMEKLKSDKHTKNIPVIFLTAKSDTETEIKGLTLGAVDYISKPFSPPLLLKRIENHLLLHQQTLKLFEYANNLEKMVEEKTNTVLNLQNSILKTVAELVECRDDITGGHIERTSNYLEVLVNALVENNIYFDLVKDWNMAFIIQSCQLHDVGKIAIPDSILKKPGKLTSEEFETMKTHTTFGVDVIRKIERNSVDHNFLVQAEIFAGTHHEKWDGSGYPSGLKGEEIPLEGRLMAIADVYDALISNRPYKVAFTHEEALEIILEGRGTHFDPTLVDLFEKYSEEFRKISSETN